MINSSRNVILQNIIVSYFELSLQIDKMHLSPEKLKYPVAQHLRGKFQKSMVTLILHKHIIIISIL